VAVLGGWPLTAPAAQSAADARKAESELQAVKTEIDRISKQVNDEQVQRDRLSRELKSAEVSVGKAREGLDDVRRERAGRASKRATLAASRRTREADLAQNRAALAGQLRAAYLIGREEPLKLLLNQQDPERAGRMFVYYSYFGRARADQIHQIEGDVEAITQLDGQVAAEDEQLAALEKQQRAELMNLELSREKRTGVLASLTAESNSHVQNLQKLKDQQSGLETLIRELRRAVEKFPIDNNDAFARLRGKLAWPVGGKLIAKFGETRAGGVKWDGVLVATERGAPVRAVYGGRIVYADWLPGLGLLTIVDHGEGYMSLYGHNERLYKAAGERVSAGDTIGSAGDSGGSNRPELYFEIRKAGKAVDPRPWFKAADP
jgi:septal ring factor EnvC (AmiA/AmiB activator)